MLAENLLSSSEKQSILTSIKEAESKTSGEIRLFLEDHCGTSTFDRAAFLFDELKVKNTVLRNGVLIYIAVDDHRFCIIGDSGIHHKVGDEFWNSIRDRMRHHFLKDEYAEAILHAVNTVGAKLAEFYPPGSDNVNELPDDIVFGK